MSSPNAVGTDIRGDTLNLRGVETNWWVVDGKLDRIEYRKGETLCTLRRYLGGYLVEDGAGATAWIGVKRTALRAIYRRLTGKSWVW